VYGESEKFSELKKVFERELASATKNDTPSSENGAIPIPKSAI
jgi:hypothetical protein